MKKLIPALCMLLIAAALLGTSTYAWFSMNTTVTATGMQVKAKSDTKFLQIKVAGSTPAWNDEDPFIEADLEMTSGKELFPVHPFESLSGDKKTGTKFAGGEPVWVTAYSTSISSSKEGVGTKNVYTELDASTVENKYALKQSFEVRLKPNTGVASVTSNLKVTGVTFEAVTQTPDDVTDGLAQSLRVLFVCGSNRFVWKNGAFVEGTADSILANTVTTTATPIDVYIYFDGEDGSCTTNNALTPDDYKMSFTLTLE